MSAESEHNTSSGNVLFLILIAVALFAALSYAVTSSSRSGSGGIEKEKAQLELAKSNNCEVAVTTALHRLKIMNGCSEDEISYELPSGLNENPSNPNNTRCFVFHPAGGGAAPCGSYLNSTVAVGPVSWGETTNWVAMTSGVFARCESFINDSDPSMDRCGQLAFTRNGADRFKICAQQTSASPSDEYDFRVAFCAAACGSPSHSSYMDGTFNDTISGGYLIGTGGSLTPYSGPCHYSLSELSCSCWTAP